MDMKLLYEAPVTETYGLTPEGAVLTFSGGNRGEKFEVGEEEYDDNDFV